MCDAVEESYTILDEWEQGGEGFRIVDVGSGPKRLHVLNIGAIEWKEERECFKWGVVVSRLLKLAKGASEQ